MARENSYEKNAETEDSTIDVSRRRCGLGLGRRNRRRQVAAAIELCYCPPSRVKCVRRCACVGDRARVVVSRLTVVTVHNGKGSTTLRRGSVA